MVSKRQHGYIEGGHVMVPWILLNHKAYLTLSHSARSALPYFLGKPKKHWNDTSRCGITFKFPFSEAGRLGFSRGTFSRVLQRLVANGFLDPVKKGGFKGAGGVGHNCFRLSMRWTNFGQPDFQEVLWTSFVQRPRQKSSTKVGNNRFNNGNGIISEPANPPATPINAPMETINHANSSHN